MAEIILQVAHLSKSFGSNKVLKDINLSVGKGEFITFLGPSGCGKTTTLRIIGGLETGDEGRIILKGQDITSFPPEQRKVNTVFQNYALFPHMDVYQNIAYGLKIRKVEKPVIRQKVMDILKLVQMEGFENRRPDQLSGGQRQRIAIARAVINEPEILLLDEPLGALDLKLRHHMQTELKQIQKELGITFIYVTHDQEEALNMSDRLVVMNEGQVCQEGTPEEIYDRPASRFVADFVGDRNIFQAYVAEVPGREQADSSEDGGFVVLDFAGGRMLAADGGCMGAAGKKYWAAIHTDRLVLSEKPGEEYCLPARVQDKHFSGAQAKFTLALKDGALMKKVEFNRDLPFEEGQDVFITWQAGHCRLIEEVEKEINLF